ncbi:MAG: NGG1p interacting factor NIF3, partial [Spirochaetaceae bacterium]|nr:NGG1p interacting factor NIF3 [Spirochaetaceae bacterium]
MYQLIFYVPESHLEIVKDAIFSAGAGEIDGYDLCCWQTEGIGQFRAGTNQNPFLGEIGKLHKEKEWKVECVVEDASIEAVVKALCSAHPYEVPAY